MKNPAKLLLIALAASLFAASPTDACTSLVASGRATPDGRPILWKHRDTDAPSNYLARVEPGSPGEIGFVGLFNAGDSIMRDAWAGMNDAGFAIMNTASYNLAPDTTDFKDREAVVMGIALRRCRTVADFAALLDSLPRPPRRSGQLRRHRRPRRGRILRDLGPRLHPLQCRRRPLRMPHSHEFLLLRQTGRLR